MSDQAVIRIHWSFWIISILSLIWNGMGIMNYYVLMNPDFLATMPEPHRTIIQSRPIWASAACAMAIFGGITGSLMLLFRKSVSYYLFIISLIGIMIAMAHVTNVLSTKNMFNPPQLLTMVLMPLTVAMFLIWYSKQAKSKSWIS